MSQRLLFKHLTRTFLVLASLFSMFACSPAHDWRTARLSSHGDQYVITFPGKALSAQKTVTLAGEAHTLTLSAVQVDGAQFALGSVPAKDAAVAQAIATALADAFTANVQAPPEQVQRTPLDLKRASGAVDMRYFVGKTDSSRFAQARFIWTPTAAYELLVVGPSPAVNAELADTFIRSMQFE